MTPRHDYDIDTSGGSPPERSTGATAADERAEAVGTPSTGPVSPAAERDQVRWGPVWAGALVALTTYLVMTFLLFALGWLDLGFDGAASTTSRGVVSAAIGIIAFFLGGMLAGAASAWRGAREGILNGVLVWALGVVGIISLALAGGTSLLGPLAEVSGQLQVPNAAPDPAALIQTARQTAGWTALALGVYVAAAALGGASGAKMWPRDGAADRR
jgi:hypothetical protein